MHKLATLRGNYTCPSSLNINGLIKHNFESEVVAGPVDLRLALQVSCDTWFYKFAVQEYYDDQKRIAKGEKPHEYLQHMADGVRVRIVRAGRPARLRADRRQLRRSRDPAGPLEQRQEAVLRGRQARLSRDQEPRPTART